MIRTYLNDTSIHGLRYLKRAKSVPCVFRLIWLVCIVGSFIAATIIIVLNVKNWENSPVVVTSVDNFDIEDNLEYPVLTLCPQSANYDEMVLRHFQEVMAMDDDVVTRLKRRLGNSLVQRLSQQRRNEVTDTSPILAAMKQCVDNSTIAFDSDKCDFIRILVSLTDTGFYATVNLKEFLVESIVNGTTVTIDNLAQMVAGYRGKTANEVKSLSKPGLDFHEWRLLVELYSYFFPLKVLNETDNEDRLPISGLNDYSIDLELPSSFQNNPNLVDFVENLLVLYNDHWLWLAELVQDKLRNESSINEEVVIQGNYNPSIRTRFFDLFNLIGIQFNWFNRYDPIFEDIMNLCPAAARPGFQVLPDFCQVDNGRKTCPKYCNIIDELLNYEEKVVKLMRMTIEEVDLDEGSVWAFPQCKFGTKAPTHQCWKPIHTHRGICYTTFNKDKPNIINGSDEEAELLILMSTGSIPTYLRNYLLFVTPPGQFSSGRYIQYPATLFDINQDLDIEVDITRVIQTTPEFRSMSLNKRQCLYPDEKELHFFPLYSQSNCIMECAWLFSADQCSCVPWFLKDVLPRFKICEFFGNFCFNTWINRRHRRIKSSCMDKCLSDCEDVEMKFYTQAYQVDPDFGHEKVDHRPAIDCKAGIPFEGDKRTNFTCQFAQNVVNNFARPHFNLSKIIRMSTTDFAKKLRFIRLNFAKMGTIRIMKTATMTIIDMISNIGGTLGLFLGFSLLSGVEIVYHLAIGVLKRLSRKKSR